MNYLNFIEIRTDKRFGKPCLKDTRISAYGVLNWLANGMTKEEIMTDLEEISEEISEEMIQACLHFSADKERKSVLAP